jgi:FtsH-binding integral membrane protein
VTPPLSPVRRRFLEFVAGVAAVHVVAIALYYVLGVAHAPAARQRMFAWVWMAATVAVVMVGLQRIKRARRSSAGRSSSQV